MFARINLRLCFGQTFGLGDDAACPLEHLRVRRAKLQRQIRLRHGQRGRAVVFDFLVGGERLLHQRIGVILNLRILQRSLGVIAPPNIAAAAVPQRANEWRI